MIYRGPGFFRGRMIWLFLHTGDEHKVAIISEYISANFRKNGLNKILKGQGEANSWVKIWGHKISCQTPFKASLVKFSDPKE